MQKLWLALILTGSIGCSTTELATDSNDQAVGRSVNTTMIRVNGESADTFLVDPATSTNGFLNASRDEIANTSSLDFSYATPDPSNPDLVTLVQGAGEIPNGAFTTSLTSARLSVTTPFAVNHCTVNIVTADFNCVVGAPITFELTWTKSGVGSVSERTSRTETFGPVTTRFRGEFASVTAIVNGSWTDHAAVDMFGNLVDSQNSTNLREITMAR